MPQYNPALEGPKDPGSPTITGFQAAPSQSNPDRYLLALNIEVADATEAATVLARVRQAIDPQANPAPRQSPQLAKLAAEAARLRQEAEARRQWEQAKARKAAEQVTQAPESVPEPEPAPPAPEETAAPQEAAQAPEPEPEPELVPAPDGEGADVETRPGMDPAKVLAAYDAVHSTESPATSPVAVQEGAHYVKGGRYDGVEIVRVQTSKSQGFGVATLVDGKKIKFDLVSGATLGVKGGPPTPEGATVEGIAPTSRQSGPAAPKVDEPVEDSNGTPAGETPDWLDPVLKARSTKAALIEASKTIGGDDLVEWAISMRERVPAFSKMNPKTFRKRVERAVGTMAPRKASA